MPALRTATVAAAIVALGFLGSSSSSLPSLAVPCVVVFSEAAGLPAASLAPQCPSAPPCRPALASIFSMKAFGNLWERVTKPIKCISSSYDYSQEGHKREISQRLNTLLSEVVGQEHVIRPVKQRLVAKLSDPSKPLVFLFTGDNGVGKTMTANLISIAMSLRCGGGDGAGSAATARGEGCHIGDAALSLTASESNFEARGAMVKRITDHALKYPRGVVIINEVLLLNPAVFDGLGPLLGRGRTFADYPHVPMNELTVILTSDFGKHVAATQGKTAAEIAQFSKTEFSKRFGLRYTSEMSAHAFLPLSYENAVKASKRFILNLPCRLAGVSAIDVSNDAVERIVEDLVVSAGLADNNGREITKVIEQKVDGVVGNLLLSKFPAGVADARVAVYLDRSKRFVVDVTSKALGISESEADEL